MAKTFRVFATCDIGDAIDFLRQRGYEVEIYPKPDAPPKSLIIEKVKSGVDGLITTLRGTPISHVSSPHSLPTIRKNLRNRINALHRIRTN